MGLRERKKQRTREALIAAAQDLFCANGFEATTVDQITEVVEVSPRTFFRYFTSKEDVALSIGDEQLTDILAAFAAQPPDVPVLTAMRDAVVGVVRAAEASAGAARYQRMLSISPALAAARGERARARLGEVAELIATRMGVDPATDPRPLLVASVAVCAVPPAVDAWRAAGRSGLDSELLGEAFDLLSAGLEQRGRPSSR